MRKPQGYRQTAAEGCFFLFVLCLPYWQSLFLAGISGTVSVLLLTCLMMFIVVRSPEVYRSIIACLEDFPLSWFPLIYNGRCLWAPMSLQVVAVGPSLAPSFQRPPPIFS